MEPDHSNTNLTLSAIRLYPLKGARAVSATRTEMTPRGPAGDRCWMVVGADGGFFSQRSHPALALVEAVETADGLVLSADGWDPILCPIPSGNSRSQVEVWRDTVDAAEGSPAASAWLSDYLGLSCRLVFQDRQDSRPITSSRGLPGEIVSFADGFPVLMCSEASLADLNGRLGDPIPMDRFRPNLVVRGGEPFEEDRWRRLTIGRTTFRNAGPCARCTVTTVDQATAFAGTEPLRTLSSYRQVDGKVLFGVNLVPEGPGTVTVGDPILILE